MATALLGFLATALIIALPSLHFVYRSPSLHVAIETAATFIGFLAAYLFAGRARRTGALHDVLLVAGLTTLATTNLLFSLLPSIVESDPGAFATWAPLAGRMIGAMLLTWAAFAPDRRIRRPSRALWHTAVLVTVGTLAVAVAVAALSSWLPPALETGVTPEASRLPRLVGDPFVLALQLVATILYAAAAWGFLNRAERTGEALLAWVAAALVLAALSRLNYFLFPSLYSEFVYTGDFFRIAFYLALLAGVSREIASYQRRLAETAIFQERRRLARDLHDGLAQELAYIAVQSRQLRNGSDRERVIARITAAADRAVDESRHALLALSRPLDESFHVTLSQTAAAVAERGGARLRPAIEHVEVPPSVAEALLRIVREGVTNAVRHGSAREVEVSLTGGDELRLVIADDGAGFDVDAPRRADALGLTSMRERTEGLGGTFRLTSEPGSGTRIEVMLP
jgi:signal transduction histidine kinase